MKKKRKTNTSPARKFKIGDFGSIIIDRVVIPVEIVDIDYAIQEYRCYSLKPGDMRIYWVSARDIRRRNGQ